MGSTIGAIFSSILTTIVVSRIHMHKFDGCPSKDGEGKACALCLFLLIIYARLVDEAAKTLTRMPKPAN